MLRINKSLTLMLLVLLAICNKSWGQTKIPHTSLYVFDQDSLRGFQEDAARSSAISEGFIGAEFKIKMFQLKRAYINNKYNIWPVTLASSAGQPQYQARQTVVPGCTNEDFEAATDGTITTANAVNGWVLAGGLNDPGLFPNANSCNLNGCCTSPPSQSAVFTTPFNDPIIGNQYPIHSVFGTSTANSANANAANPQIMAPMLGNKVIRINNGVNDYSIEKLSKTFAVTATNSLFQFAFISVFATSHPCCEAGAFRIRLYNASGNNTLIPCPTFSVSAPGGDCAGGPGTPNYFLQQSLTPYTYTPTVFSPAVTIYNPWQISSIDLTPYIGSNITIEIIVTDCNASGHYGYCYFDAQCGPMTIYGNGTPYSSSATTGTVPTCGAAGATLCAADGLGPYSWAGPGVGPPYTTPAMSNQCYTTNLSGTYTLYMNPAGSCAPISKVISATITPAPLLVASVQQAVCGNTTAVVTLTPSGSAAVPSSITWSPAPLFLSSNTLTGTYAIPPPNTIIVTTITATDPLGCKVVVNPTINPAAPIPTFAIVNVTGTSSITCSNSFVNLVALSNYTYGTLNFTWNSASTNSVGSDVEFFSPGVFTVTAQDPVSLCSTVLHYTVGLNTTPPTATVTPMFQSITCLSGVQTVTATANPTINITHYFSSPNGGTVSINAPIAIYDPAPGDNIYTLVNNLTGCSITKTFTVATSDNFPSLTVSSANNFTIGCGIQHSVAAVNIAGETTPQGGAVNYTILTSVSPTNYGLASTQQYSFTIPGTYTAVIEDVVSHCRTKVPFSIIQDIQGPNISANVPVPVLSCYTPSATMIGQTTNSLTAFAWIFPGPAGGTVSVNSPTVTVNTTTNLTSPLVANYTLSIQNLINGCFSYSVIPVKQNLFRPTAAAGGASLITCATPTVQMNNLSITTIPPASGFPTNSIVSASWAGPTPQVPSFSTANYVAAVAGIYTITATDLNNGCSSTKTINIGDGRIYPVINNPPPPTTTLDCGATNQKIGVSITGSKVGFSYLWSGPSTASITGTTNDSLRIYQAGHYNVTILNTISGCSASGEVVVVNGTLDGDFVPDVTSGFAPLAVTFSNTSHSSNASTGTRSITSVWNYGNGTSATFSTTTDGASVYTQPGTYTVTLYTAKGSCTDIDSKTISVDIPSKLEVPNVFTPNGDGVNDFFFLKVANMTEITANIFDRWGRKVYEITSTTGNISWDGTSMVGGKAAAGVYFYTIKGKGKDDKDYNTKGTITLFK